MGSFYRNNHLGTARVACVLIIFYQFFTFSVQVDEIIAHFGMPFTRIQYGI